MHLITILKKCVSYCIFLLCMSFHLSNYASHYAISFMHFIIPFLLSISLHSLLKPKYLKKPLLNSILYTSLILCWFFYVWFFWYSLKIWISVWELMALRFLNMHIPLRIYHLLEDVPFILWSIIFPFVLKLFRKKPLKLSLITSSNISHCTLQIAMSSLLWLPCIPHSKASSILCKYMNLISVSWICFAIYLQPLIYLFFLSLNHLYPIRLRLQCYLIIILSHHWSFPCLLFSRLLLFLYTNIPLRQ